MKIESEKTIKIELSEYEIKRHLKFIEDNCKSGWGNEYELTYSLYLRLKELLED